MARSVPAKQKRKTAEARLSVRITPEDRRRFEEARIADHSRTLTDWILRTLHSAADQTLQRMAG